MTLDLGFMYAIVAFMAMISNIIILSRTMAEGYHMAADRWLARLLWFFIVFSLVDGIWGLFFSRSLWISRTGLTLFSYGFHLGAALSAFMWAGYLIHYLRVNKKSERYLTFIRWFLITCQMLLILPNIFTNRYFVITENAEYHTGNLRTVGFLLQFAYYGILGVFVLRTLIAKEWADREEDKKRYLRALVFSLTPLAMGIAQLIYPDGPMYSLGFMLTGTVIYSFNVTADREEYARAQAANEAKSKFLFNMSHDIRTPMNAILGFSYMAQKHIDDPKVVEDSLNKINTAGQHLLSLINDILDMSRIESGKMQLSESIVGTDLGTEKIAPIIQTAAEEKNIRFTYSYVNIPDGYIVCDSLHVNEIVLNILSNAVKYTNPGGKVEYTVEQLDDSDEETASYRLTVKDNGIGMDKEFLPHIFEDFSRENTSTKSGIQGTGLGMAIVKQLIDMMGGSIAIDSAPNVGTTVVICLRFMRASVDDVYPEETEKTGDLSSFKGKRILLVEDNELNREIAKEVLSEFGFSVDEADDGSVAVEMLNTSGSDAYDLVLMDIQMPVMDGFEATRKIRELPDPGFRKLPILAMTANAFEEDKRNALDAGMNDHLAKPIDIEELTSKLFRFLS